MEWSENKELLGKTPNLTESTYQPVGEFLKSMAELGMDVIIIFSNKDSSDSIIANSGDKDQIENRLRNMLRHLML